MAGPTLDSEGLYPTRQGSIGTFTGRMDPLDPRHDEINIEDIAHALARQCRFNGHCVGFISVARHSIWVSDELHAFGPEMQFAGLLHDAPEAYIGDMVRPLKRTPEMQAFRDADAKIEKVIAEVFGIPNPLPEEVVEADHYVLVERELPDLRYTWHGDYRDDERTFLGVYGRLKSEIES